MSNPDFRVGDRVEIIPYRDGTLDGVRREDYKLLLQGPTFVVYMEDRHLPYIGIRQSEMKGGHKDYGVEPFWFWHRNNIKLYDPDGNY